VPKLAAGVHAPCSHKGVDQNSRGRATRSGGHVVKLPDGTKPGQNESPVAADDGSQQAHKARAPVDAATLASILLRAEVEEGRDNVLSA
jgi:hypothetical protein